MQSAAWERERPRRKPASLVVLVAWCSIAVTIVSPACVAQDALPKPLTPSQSLWPAFPKALVYRLDNTAPPTPVYVVDQTACEAKVDKKWGFSEPETWAWKQICGHLPVDFDERKANECAEHPVDGRDHDTVYNDALKSFRNKPPGELADDPSRRLSGNFLSKVFGEPI